ncbi:MAG: flavodoxin family protein [Desulfobulbus sp.]|jgi:multimeric flavodoxin WrbA
MLMIGINGSPRKNWNTGTLVQKALDGAAAAGWQTELVHLYDLAYQGCRSCFSCKMKDGAGLGRCAVNDALQPVLQRILEQADALVVGSPIYFGQMSGATRSFIERLLFPSLVYSNPVSTMLPRTIKTGLILTMGAPEAAAMQMGYDRMFEVATWSFTTICGHCELLCSYDTYQFPDYDKVVMEYADPVKKAERRATVFPEDCEQAVALGRRLAG